MYPQWVISLTRLVYTRIGDDIMVLMRSYLPLPIGIVFPINALQRLRIPPEFVVAGIRINDSRTIISGYHLLRASLCLAECHRGREEHERD
jgi:hypothetical protein